MADLKKDLLSLKFSSNINISGAQEQVTDLSLEAAGDVTASLTGTVLDGVTPVLNAAVKVYNQDGTPLTHTVTDTEGKYLFNSLQTGTYNVVVAAQGYRLTAPTSITLTEGETEVLDFSLSKDDTLILGAVSGIISTLNGETKLPVSGVKMSLIDNTDATAAVTYTVSDGEYAFYDIPNGSYNLLATADGFVPSDPVPVTITDHALIKSDITLEADPNTDTGVINGLIKDSLAQAVVGCFVGLYQITTDGEGKTQETLISHTKTNAEGKYLFGNLAAGQYVVKAKMNA